MGRHQIHAQLPRTKGESYQLLLSFFFFFFPPLISSEYLTLKSTIRLLSINRYISVSGPHSLVHIKQSPQRTYKSNEREKTGMPGTPLSDFNSLVTQLSRTEINKIENRQSFPELGFLR